ncbi:MAG: DUF2281 domain-containing protein [Deferrisomatales bacterium]|nr:DUF2281 domain-containing protein [Deferrisomatales bacterium]
MGTADLVRSKLETLPPAAQQEVLDFVEFLVSRRGPEDGEWSFASLSTALDGMEGDEWPDHAEDDYTERWR